MTISLLAALLGAALAPVQSAPDAAGACAPDARYPVHVHATGLKEGGGMVLVELFAATDQGFLSGDTRDQQHPTAIARRWVTPKPDGTADACVAAPSQGRFGLLVTHDRDGTPKFSVSKDGLAMPGNTKLGRHRPAIAETMIQVGSVGAQVQVTMQYLRGLAGFGPAA